MRHKVFSSVLLASMAIWSVNAELVQIANKPYDDGLGNASGGVYRIPAMAKSTNGVIVAVYDCRYNSSGDLPNVIDLAENWSGDNGATWSKPRVAVDVPNTNNYQKVCNIGDPCIVYDPAGDKFWLMGITGGGLASSHDGSGNSIADVVLYTRGTGENDTWQEWAGGPEGNRRSVKQMILNSLADVEGNETYRDENQIRGILQGPGHGIVQRQTVYAADGETVLMPAGAIVFPMQYFIDGNFSNTRTFAVYSTDGGAHWNTTKLTPANDNAQENCVMELDDGSWYMICKGKTQSQKQRQLFRTTDFANWTYCGSITPSEWVQGSCLRIGTGWDGKSRYAACFTTASTRSNVTLHFGRDTSCDAGATRGVEWDLGRQIVYPGATGGKSYNSLVMLDSSTLAILIEIDGHIYVIKEDVSDILKRDEIDVDPPVPAAVWDGNFSQDNASQNGWWIENWNDAHAADWSSVTLDRDNQGLMINSESGKSGMTVLVKYSGLSNSASAHRVLAASCVTASHKYDRTGIALKSDGKLVGLWNSSTTASSDTDNGSASGSIASSGVMAFTYGIGGTYLYYGSDTASISSTAAWGASGLKSSDDSNNSSIYGAAIGGMCAEASRVGYEAAKGMTISGIAVFDRVLSVEEMNACKWPTEQVIDIDADTSVSAINANIDAAVKSIRLNVAPGVVIDVDQAFSDAVPVTVKSKGNVTLSAESQPNSSWFANVDFSGVKGGLLRSWLTPGVVGFNFRSTSGVDVSGALAAADNWIHNNNSASGTSTAMFADGLSTLKWSSANTWACSGSTIISGYLDDGANGGNGATVTLSNVPYETYDIIVYCSSDTANGDFLAKTVNGTTYTWDSTAGAVVVGNSTWGKAALSTPVYGVNALRIKNLSGPLTIYGLAKNGNSRGGIAAIEIMPPNTPDNIRTYTLTLSGTATTWRAGTWTLNGESADAPTSGFVEIEATASTALTVDQAVNLADLKVRGDTNIVINVATNDTGSLYAIKATIESGVLQQGSPSVFGATPTVVVEDGATFDLNGKAINAANAVMIAGAGAGDWPWALTSSGGAGGAILGGLYLSANAIIGGANELKVGQTGAGYFCYLQGFTLTKTGTGALTGTNMNTPGTGTIDVQGGAMSVNQWNNLNSASGDTTVILNSGTSLVNGTDRVISMSALGLYGGTLSTASKAFKVNTAFRGAGETANLAFGDGASASLTGNLTITASLTLDGSMTFLKDAEATSYVVVTPATLTASSGTISVGDGVIFNLATNRPAATLDIADGAALAVRLNEGEQKVSLSATGKPSSVILLDADGNHISSPSVSFADGTLAVAPLSASGSISINFHHGTGLDTAADGKAGLAGCKVYLDAWNNVSGNNNSTLSTVKRLESNGDTVTSHSMSVAVSGTRGSYWCNKLNAATDPLHGYIDDNDSYTTPTVTVTGIPYDKYRVVIYHSTDTANISFGYDLVNGIPFTGVSGHASVGTANWGDSGPNNSAYSIMEGVNTLVTPVLPNNAEKTLTVTGHRISTSIRGCIAAIQIFDASGDNSELDVATNRVYSTYKDGPWVFPADIAVADPAKFGGMIIGTNAVSQSLGSTAASTISATALAAIPETATGTLVSLGVEGGHSVHAKYYGNGVFGLSYDNAGAVVSNKTIDVAGVHIWTLTFDANSGAAFYKDGVKVIEASSIKWTYGGAKKITGSVEFGARHDQTDPLTGAIIYAARTDYGNAVAMNVGNVISKVYSDQECPGVSELTALAEKAELFTHLVGYGDTEGLLALMPHRTSTYEYGGWHCPLDANLASGEYLDGLTTVFTPVVQNLPGVSTNAAAASVLAQIPRTAAGVIANITVVNGSSTLCVFARSNGDGTVSLGWENAAKHKTSGILDAWDDIHVWTLVSHRSSGCKLYRDGELVLEDPDLKFSDYKAGTSIMFGNATNGGHPLAGMKVYAVHTDFGASSEMFNAAEEIAASVFDSFDFMEELPEGATIDEKVEAFVHYSVTGVAYEPPPVFDPETDAVAETCVLRISEIMPKPTDALNRGKLEGMDVNGLESGWVEVENTSPDKWADLGDYKFIRSNRGKKTGQADYGNFPSVMIAPGSRYVFYMSERYSNSADMTVSAWAEADEDGVKPKLYGADLKDILVWPDKVNPKKSPFVRLIYTPTDAIVDTVVVPSDVPEGCSIIVGDAGDGEATKRWLCSTPTCGRANTATESLVRIGPNAGPLYEIAGGKKHDSANEFARLAPPAVPGEDYEITFSFNPVMHPTVAGGFRDEDAITDIRLVYRTDLTNATTIASVDMTTDNFDAKDWGHTYTATIPHAVFDTIGAGHLIQWKFIAADASGNEWTSPSFNNPDDGYEWYGTIVEPDPETQMSATLPTWHMFVDEASRAQMDYDKDDSRYTLPNGARVAIYDSSTSNYYDYVRIDLRGNTSAGFTKKGHGLRFAKSHPMTMTDAVTGETIEEIRKTSLISEFADPSYMRQMIAFWLWRKMGNLVPFDFPVRCNLNGEFYQLAFNSERFTDELIEDVYGLDKYGYGYKNVGTLKSGSSTTAGGIEKKTPDDENESDITVLQNELRSKITAAQNVSSSPDGGDTGLDNAALTKFVVEKFDLPAWLNYLASARITQEMDDVWANVCIYYDNPDIKEGARGTGTWMPLGYDFNLTFGQHYRDGGMGASGLKAQDDWFKCHPFYGGNRVRCYSSSAMTSTINYGNDGFEAVYQSAKFRRLFLRRLRTLMDQQLKEPGTAEGDTPFMAKMREMADLMRADAERDQIKWPNNGTDNAIDVWTTRPADMDAGVQDIWDNYVVPRREHLYVTHSVTNTAKEVGYGSNLNAGIPEAQSPVETLAPNISISNLTPLDAAEAEALDVAGQLYDTEVVVIRNDNDEVVDMSGWRLAFSVDFTFPAGTVCDANDSIYIVADRRAYIDAHDSELTDQVIVGNAAFTGAGPVALYDADGALVYSAIPQTDELKYLRLHSFYGNTLDGGDAGEWFTLTNISDTVTLDLKGVTVCFLKQGDPEEGTAHCHVTLENKKGKGSIAPLKSWTASQADYSDKGWEKIQNNKQQITIYDKYGSVCQSLKVTQKSFKLAYGNGGYLVCDSIDASVTKDSQWHEALYELPNNGELSESFAADSQEAANELIANAKPALSDDDVAAGLEPQYLKIVAQPVDGEAGKYKAVVVVNPNTVEVPVMAQIEEGEATVDPLTVESDEVGSKVTVGVSNATVGLWYGFIWTDSLGDKPFENDVESFKRATSTSVKIESKAEAAKSAQKAFFRVKVSAAKP